MTSSHTLPAPTSTSDPAAATLIRCTTTADFLAALPRLVGFTAPDSLFLVLFSGSQARNAVRVDLPDSEDPAVLADYVDEVEQLLHRARQVHGPSAPAAVIASSLSFAEAGGPPWKALAVLLLERLRRVDTAPKEFCCLAPDGWVSYLDTRAPKYGRPLSEITSSPVAAAEAAPPLRDIGTFREVTAAEQAAVAQAVVALNSDSCRSERSPVASEITRLFTPEPLTSAETALLVRALQTDAGWAATFDELARGASIGAPRPETRQTLADAVADRPEASPRSTGETAHAVMAGLRAASEHLAFLVPLAPMPAQPGLISLCALAWWVRGLESVASRQIAHALALDPQHKVAQLARQVIDHGSVSMTSLRE